MKYFKIKTGFTLAEVLISLAIIGVVAALTISTVIRNYQKTQTVVRLKKAYSALANTTNLAIADYGPITDWETYEYNETSPEGTSGSEHFANKYMIPYLKVLKNCGTDRDAENTKRCRFEYKGLNFINSGSFNSEYTRFYLNDGTLIGLRMSYVGIRKYAYIYIDVNGQKKPNTIGRDIFLFAYYVSWPILEGRFMPWCFERTMEDIKGAKNEEWMCWRGANGQCCAARIMKEGWQITDDYPW